MLVSDLQEMEAIVRSRNDLEWDGWDIIQYKNSSSAMYSVDGAFHRGKWMKKKVFPVTKDGWYLPNTIGRVDGQVEG